jgi:hypothetical protein
MPFALRTASEDTGDNTVANKNEKLTPFGLTLLTDVDLKAINGGRHKKHGPIVTTMHMSIPQPAFPKGDNG